MSELDDYIKEQSETKQVQAIRIGGQALAESLAKNGWSATLDVMLWVTSKKASWIVDALLVIMPGAWSMGKFLAGLEAFECQAEDGELIPGEKKFKEYVRMGHII